MEDRNIYYNGRVKIPDEITDIKDKIVMGMTGRQLLFSAIALGIGGLSMFLLYSLTPLRGSGWVLLSVAFASPALAFGFVTPAGLALEDWLTIWWSNNVKSAPTRTLVAENAYEKALLAAKAHDEGAQAGKAKGRKAAKKAAKKRAKAMKKARKARAKSAYAIRM